MKLKMLSFFLCGFVLSVDLAAPKFMIRTNKKSKDRKIDLHSFLLSFLLLFKMSNFKISRPNFKKILTLCPFKGN